MTAEDIVSVWIGDSLATDVFHHPAFQEALSTGTVDLIRKTIGVHNQKGEAETVYSMDCAVGIERYRIKVKCYKTTEGNAGM